MHTLTISNGIGSDATAETIEGTFEEVAAALNGTLSTGDYTLMIHKTPTGISTHYRNKKSKS